MGTISFYSFLLAVLWYLTSITPEEAEKYQTFKFGALGRIDLAPILLKFLKGKKPQTKEATCSITLHNYRTEKIGVDGWFWRDVAEKVTIYCCGKTPLESLQQILSKVRTLSCMLCPISRAFVLILAIW